MRICLLNFLIDHLKIRKIFPSAFFGACPDENREASKGEKTHLHDSTSGAGGAAVGLDLSSGKGINSLLSLGGRMILPCFQSSLACSILSFLDETKFHQMNRSPNGSPPISISVDFSLAWRVGSTPSENTSICPS